MTTTTQDTNEREELYDIFKGKTLKENLRDIIAGCCTGYSYSELEKVIKAGDELLDDEEILGIDSTVNLLAHLFKYLLKSQKAALLEEIRGCAPKDYKKNLNIMSEPGRQYFNYANEKWHSVLDEVAKQQEKT